MYCVKIWNIAIAIFQAKIIVDTACVKQKYIDVLLQNLLLAWQNYSMLIGWEEYNQCCSRVHNLRVQVRVLYTFKSEYESKSLAKFQVQTFQVRVLNISSPSPSPKW